MEMGWKPMLRGTRSQKDDKPGGSRRSLSNFRESGITFASIPFAAEIFSVSWVLLWKRVAG